VDDFVIPEITAVHIVHNSLFAADFKGWKSNLVQSDSKGKKFPYIRLHSNGVFRPKDSVGAVGDLWRVVSKWRTAGSFILHCVDTLTSYRLTDFLDGIAGDALTVAIAQLAIGQDAHLYGRVDYDPATDLVSNFYEKKDVGIGTVWLGPAFFPRVACKLLGEYIQEKAGLGDVPDNLGEFIQWYAVREPVKAWLPERGRAFDIGTKAGWLATKKIFKKEEEVVHNGGEEKDATRA
jgi:NDP-sugar pyrophosphorylase family protein